MTKSEIICYNCFCYTHLHTATQGRKCLLEIMTQTQIKSNSKLIEDKIKILEQTILEIRGFLR